ncbi:hypothetical protein SLEP1_g58058 [Rubroshorea leprosula]|uniref:Maturase K n=1 Tax=Rubroshorea leprosula TaxID=152421 RepID=A0AAV5MN16_9ROSI|nr:hypothetical protein SLEP1_g58058 [Rubroshorea leprosula]
MAAVLSIFLETYRSWCHRLCVHTFCNSEESIEFYLELTNRSTLPPILRLLWFYGRISHSIANKQGRWYGFSNLFL